ncbi:MAG: hypothetical protein WCO09_02905 [bacterium]
MTDTAKATLWVIIILVLVGGIWWFVGSNPNQTPPPAPVEPVQVQATTTEVQVEDASTSISIQDKTDEALSTDLNKVDDQLKNLNTDSSN